MNERIRKLAFDAHLINYIDLETPRHYFISGNAEEDEVHLFGLYCIREAIKFIETEMHEDFANYPKWYKTIEKLEKHFGVEECTITNMK